MDRFNCKMRVLLDGSVEVVDPTPEDLPLLQEIDPDYRIRIAPLQGFKRPRFQELRRWKIPILEKELLNVDTSTLKNLHEAEMLKIEDFEQKPCDTFSNDSSNLLDLKIEISRRKLITCNLCGRGCRVNRLVGETGYCGLDADAYVGGTFIHIAEEPPINPSLLVELYGCGMRCKFCQKSELLEIKKSRRLDGYLWEDLDPSKARSLTFIGGNPDESVYSILRFLKAAPDDFDLPIVWNCNGYGNIVTYKILEGTVDVYIPDLKYGNDKCAAKWSGITGYVKKAHDCIAEMANQNVPVFVRMLVLPGHSKCCHIPSIHFLKRYADSISLNLMDQYHPEFSLSEPEGPMSGSPEAKEIWQILDEAKRAGLKLI